MSKKVFLAAFAAVSVSSGMFLAFLVLPEDSDGRRGLLRYSHSHHSAPDPKTVELRQRSAPTLQQQREGQEQQHQQQSQVYTPSLVEKYILDHSIELGFASENNPKGCTIWNKPSATNSGIHKSLMDYSADLDEYNKILKDFIPFKNNENIIDIIRTTHNHHICDSLKPHPQGLTGLFPSNQLSHSSSGYIEPLTPPMRHHIYCTTGQDLMTLDYLVHDFEAMCRDIKGHSKSIFIDMGASLSFNHRDDNNEVQPAIRLLEIYEQHGFHFDHIYGFEITFTEPSTVFRDLIPERYLKSYHWINDGVSTIPGDKMNPLNSILQQFSEDDFIVVKLDIDTPDIEMELVGQLLEGGPGGIYHRLVDQFYFEHHVHMEELAWAWGSSMRGTIKESLELFGRLREKGIPAHFWP